MDEEKECELVTLVFSERTEDGRERFRELAGAGGSILVSTGDGPLLNVQGLDDDGMCEWEFFVPTHRVCSLLTVTVTGVERYSAVIVEPGSHAIEALTSADTDGGVQDAYRKHDDGARDA